MPYVALVLVGIVLVVMLAKMFVAAKPAALAQGLRWAGIGVAALGVGALLLRGQLWLAGFLLPILVGLWQGKRPSWFTGGFGGFGRPGAEPSPGQTSSIRTDFLELALDHDSGALTGTVLRGASSGRRVESLAQAELIALWRETLEADAASTPLVETVLDRSFPDWRDAVNEPTGAARPRAGAMSRAEALRILGLEGDPSPEQVAEAHRRLMMTHHPDHGGSAYLAALINEAKSVLTGSR